MSDFHRSPRALRRLRVADVPALFSEGPEADAPGQGKNWWPEPPKLHLRVEWPSVLGRCMDFPKQFWVRNLGA
ncbi:MAG: hypothetical protein ABSC72_05440 [Methylovirgula sp.]|jgi:hypothetical protein